jgi:VanZ family protein
LNKQKWLRFVPAFLWMVLIFCFSAEDAAASSESSEETLGFLLQLFGTDFSEKLYAGSELHALLIVLLRKSAHLFLFTVLSMLLYFAGTAFSTSRRLPSLLFPFGTGVLYAVTDEIHQYFVPGRACQWQDVVIDTVGVCLGILAAVLIQQIFRKCRPFSTSNTERIP